MYQKGKRFQWVVLLLAIASIALFWTIRGFRKPISTQVTVLSTNEIASKEELGRRLFFDKRLSKDASISCADCHHPELAFTDGKMKSIGVGGREAFRNAPTLLNLKDADAFMFDAHIKTLEEQAIVPIQDVNEMNHKMGDLIKRMQTIPEYAAAAKRLYKRTFDAWVLTRSLAAFERTLISNNSAFDAYSKGEKHTGWNEDAAKGWQLFQKMECIACHQLPNFTNYEARNNGLYSDYKKDEGKFRIRGDSTKIGAFKVPTLRNVALTAPYMHDGSKPNLESVIAHYSSGGSTHANKDQLITKRSITAQEQIFLISFLHSLTDTSYMVNYR